MKPLLLLLAILLANSVKSQVLEYPKAYKENIVDTFYNQPITDEYRWLENSQDPRCKTWLEQQDDLTSNQLRKAALKWNSHVLIDKYSYAHYSNPKKMHDYYFTYAYYNDVSVPALFVQYFLTDNSTVLVDPNFISKKDKIILKNYSVSKDSKYLAYQFSRNGSDWGEIRIVNIKTGYHLKDQLTNVKFSLASWKDDSFYYSRYPDNGLGQTVGQEVYLHKLGTEQSEDQLIFRRAQNPAIEFYINTTYDERYFILEESDPTKDYTNTFYIDFNDESPALRPLLTKLPDEDNLTIIGNRNNNMIAWTEKDANNGQIVQFDPKSPKAWKVLIPEYNSALLLEVKLLEDKIITVYQTNGSQQIIFFDYQGTVLHAIELPQGTSAYGFNGDENDKKLLFSMEGYTQPKTIYVLDVETFETKPYQATVINFDYTLFETKMIEYESFDGTKVPLSLIYKKGIDLTGNNPTLLKAYGGFGSVETPYFSSGIVHFLNKGGIFAFANIRGGGDKGREWALHGRGENKMNSFKDFIAAAEFLINNGYTSPEKLAITGASNGGLVVGVAMTQRPDLFKVAVPVVAPMDMLRFEKFTIGHFHINEYGSINDSIGFKNLYAYTPLHNIKEDVNYPATLIMTSEFDDRVPPLHSYKFAAKLQSRAAQKNPILLRVEKKSGHNGAVNNLIDNIDEDADMYNFILSNLKMN